MNNSGPKSSASLKNEVISTYQRESKWFQDILDERSDEEIKFDNVVLRKIDSGKSIKKALDIAAIEFPDEALEYDDDNIDDITAHYDYFVNHVKIMNQIKELAP